LASACPSRKSRLQRFFPDFPAVLRCFPLADGGFSSAGAAAGVACGRDACSRISLQAQLPAGLPIEPTGVASPSIGQRKTRGPLKAGTSTHVLSRICGLMAEKPYSRLLIISMKFDNLPLEGAIAMPEKTDTNVAKQPESKSENANDRDSWKEFYYRDGKHEANIENINHRLNEIHIDNAGIKTDLADFKSETKTDMSLMKTDMSLMKTDISLLKTDVSLLKTDVSILKTDVSLLKTDVSLLKDDVSILKNDVSLLKNDVSLLKTDVSLLKADVSLIKNDVSLLTNDVSLLKTDISLMKNDIFDFKAEIRGEFSSFKTEIKADIKTLQENININISWIKGLGIGILCLSLSTLLSLWLK
jgi:hypothetical protein